MLNPWYLYDDSPHTPGAVFLWGWGAYLPGVAFDDTSSPHRGTHALKLVFDNTIPPGGAPWWTAFVLAHSVDVASFPTTPPLDLTSAGYTKCTYWAKATQPCFSEIAAADVVVNQALTTIWTQYTINMTPADLASVTNLFRVSLPTTGVETVWIDDVIFE